MLLYIRNFANKIWTMEVESSDTVEEIATRFSELEGIPAEDFRFLYAGSQLKYGTTLSDYNISNDSTILVIVKVKKDQ